MLATRRNCSNKPLGKKLHTVYLPDTAFGGKRGGGDGHRKARQWGVYGGLAGPIGMVRWARAASRNDVGGCGPSWGDGTGRSRVGGCGPEGTAECLCVCVCARAGGGGGGGTGENGVVAAAALVRTRRRVLRAKAQRHVAPFRLFFHLAAVMRERGGLGWMAFDAAPTPLNATSAWFKQRQAMAAAAIACSSGFHYHDI